MKPYYQDEWVTIYHGDCREILPDLPKVDLVLTDPPYVGLKGKLEYINNTGVGKHYSKTATVGDIWKASHDWLDIVAEKAELGLLIFCQFHDVADIRKGITLKPICLTTWHARNSPPSVQNRPRYTTNFIWAFEVRAGLNWRNLDTFYDIPKLATGCMATERFVDSNGSAIHPTQKPSLLISKLMSIGGDSVLDPFLGTGTTAVAAKKLNRHCIGIEIEEKYCKIAAKRCSQQVFDLS